MDFVHTPVMPDELLGFFPSGCDDALMVDCTTGEGGHSELFLKKFPSLRVIGVDCDSGIQEKAVNRLAPFGKRFEPVHAWFDEFWEKYEGNDVDFILFDLGISTYHYLESGRGFSFRKAEKLDMRLDDNLPVNAEDVVNSYPQQQLADIIFRYGEERYSRRIASEICKERKKARIGTSDRLAEIVFNAVPYQYRRMKLHPATKTFQAIRIEVNRELERLEHALEKSVAALKPSGRMAVITFHSLEDRPVKWFFRSKGEELKILTPKPVVPSETECRVNPPSRSAKLRVVERK